MTVVRGPIQLPMFSFDDGDFNTADVLTSNPETAPEPGTLFSESFSSGSSFTASEGSNVNSGSHGASGGSYTFDGTTNGSSSDGAVTLTSSEIDISGHSDIALNIDISHSGGLEASGSVADYLNVYVVVDGVRQQVVDIDGSASEDGSLSITVTGLPEGSVATIEIEAKTTLAGETYSINSVSLESGVESTPETEGLQSFSGFFGGDNDDFLVGTTGGEEPEMTRFQPVAVMIPSMAVPEPTVSAPVAVTILLRAAAVTIHYAEKAVMTRFPVVTVRILSTAKAVMTKSTEALAMMALLPVPETTSSTVVAETTLFTANPAMIPLSAVPVMTH